MSWTSVTELLKESEGVSLIDLLIQRESEEQGLPAPELRTKMGEVLDTMDAVSRQYDPELRSGSGLSGGQAARYESRYQAGGLVGGPYFNAVIREALCCGESNACMRRIVAAPTAGSCGVLPAVLLPVLREGTVSREDVIDALFVAGAFGEIIVSRATVSGAEGGCQAEIGSASAMAAAALTYLYDGTAEMCANAAAFALAGLLGLVCDPIAGLVEVPCVKRNVTGAVQAVAAANLALAGLPSRIPCDEVIDAMGEVGSLLNADLRETGIGGLAGTPTGRSIAGRVLAHHRENE
ncbi:MAG: L-serine ammonia-lyase, iron-sulfur-dependent, subunit alpha [Clostridia bacterium]|nr:L-serine ammonia-lyase, iron-sulfur-dependent, subunit alpha [Clostridia bacterium]